MQSVTGGTVREDGNVYYVIGSADGNSEFLVRCKTIGQRNHLKGKGICFVEEAYKGDSTVGTGWAMYLTVGTSTTTTSPVWVKIAEQESVEGAWNLQQELIRSLVKITTFAAHQQSNDVEFKKIWNKITQIGSFDNHSHNNKALLDNLTDASGQLKYKNKPINGSVYVYNEGADSAGTGLKWINPVDETITSGGHTSDDIARLFIGTSVAYPGQTLRIVNLDKSVSTYLVVGDDDNLTTVFLGNISSCESEKRVRFVASLPTPSASYTNELFCVIPPSYNGDKIGHFYACTATGENVYAWVDLSETEWVPVTGASITSCIKKSWNTVKISFVNPSNDAIETYDVGGGAAQDHWGKTYLVRKAGSAPASKDDGIVIKVSEGTSNETVEDIIPLTREDFYYGVFSETVNGRKFQNSTMHTSKAEFISWKTIRDSLSNGTAGYVFEIGDILAFPHSIYGNIPCFISDISEDGKTLKVVSLKSIANLPVDGFKYIYAPAKGVYENGVMYCKLIGVTGGGAGRVVYEFDNYATASATGSEYVTGETIPEDSGIFLADRIRKHCTTMGGGGSTPTSKMFYFNVTDCPFQTSNLYKWLNGSGNEWFVASDEFDAIDDVFMGLSGFKGGFVNPVDSGTEIKSMIQEITVCRTGIEGLIEYYKKCLKFSGESVESNKRWFVFNDMDYTSPGIIRIDSSGEVSFHYYTYNTGAIVFADVFPVITLGISD